MDLSEVRIPLTLKQVDSIYWLGRYTERVLTTIRIFMNVYDSQLDSEFDYGKYCTNLDIYNGFSSIKDFCLRYPFDMTYPSSIISSMSRAYDNGIMLREIIGSEALSYIELAQRRLEEAQYSKTPVLDFQKVIDCIMAFKGAVNDSVIDRNIRNILNCGLSLERIDMYLRLSMNKENLGFECRRLANAISYTDLSCDDLTIRKICTELTEEDDFMDSADKMVLLQLIDSLFVSK